MKKLTKINLVALVLVIAMMLSVTSCFNIDTPTTTTTTTTTTTSTTTGNSGGDKPDPNPHVCVFGEWTVIEEATNTEDGLRERCCECGEIEQEVIEASGKEYYIQYRNLKTADYPKENGYNSKEGLLNLPIPEAEGYIFVGWYTASIGGELVDYIPEGSNKNYILFAHWELISYEITYKNVPNNTNVTSYDIEDKLKLETPKWSGLEFTHWSDEEGNIYEPDENITVLPERMSGDLILTANWKVLRNIATLPLEGEKLVTAYSSDGVLYFIFELGTIEHVVLDSISPDVGMYYKNDGEELSLTLSKSVSVGEETVKSVSNTVSKSISSTKTFSHANNWANENSLSEKAGISYGASFDAKFVAGHIDGSYEVESTSSSSYGHSNTTDISSGSSSGTSNTVSSSLSYKKEMTSQISETKIISADLPKGYYAYVHAGNIRVWGVVTYEIATGNYYIDTYSRLDNMHSMTMYYPDVNQLNNPNIEELNFNIPEEKILSYVENWKPAAWIEKDSGSFYFATFPSGFDKDHDIYKSMQQAPYEEYETATTKRVVSIEKVGYVYWHWMYDTSAGAGDRIIYYKEGTYSLNGYGYHDFGAFLSSNDYRRTTSNRNQPTPDYYWYTDTGRTSNAESQGSKYWYRFEYYICTYTDYILAE